MRRIITIVILISIVVLIILGIGWLMSRRSATREGSAAPSFREFITGDSGTSADPNIDPGSLSSEFDQDGTPPTPEQGGTGGSLSTGSPSIDGSLSAPGTQVSAFTNDTYSPGSSSGGSSGSGTPGQGGTGTVGSTTPGTTGTSTPGGSTTPGPVNDPDPNVVVVYNPTTGQGGTGTTPSTTTPAPTTTPPQCSEADVTIVFTPTQLAELKTLERRFYTIAESVRTDEDISREITNYDTFALKGLEVFDLYNTCVQKTPNLPNPAYARRVPTPFWNDLGNDRGGFIVDGTNDVRALSVAGITSLYGKQRLEFSLRLNLW